MQKTIIWDSRLCPCAFELAFEYGQLDTKERPYSLVGRVAEFHLEAKPSAFLETAPEKVKVSTCSEHGSLKDADAYAAVCALHDAAGMYDDFRKVTTNSFTPVTCGCMTEVQFHNDFRETEDPRIVRPHLKECEVHEGLDPITHSEVIQKEVRSYSIVVNALIANAPKDMLDEAVQVNGKLVYKSQVDPTIWGVATALAQEVKTVFKEGCEPTVSFDEVRSIKVSLPDAGKAYAADFASAVLAVPDVTIE